MSRNSKRRREDEEDEVGNDTGESPSKKGRTESEYGPEVPETRQYIRGSIQRIKLHNFVTYDDVEFCPGARLNLVIGPNGSGKSTIVCGICLGLNGSPKLLGRADELFDYIKMGATEALVEIELHDIPKNVVITRIIRADDDNERKAISSWRLNGKKATQGEIDAVIRSFNIQVSNLVQFLPQDRVADFAKLNNRDLLRETEKAVGDSSMLQQHDELISLRKQEKELHLNKESAEKELATVNEKLKAYNKDLLVFQERAKLMKDLENYEKKRPWVAFETAKTAIKNLIDRKKVLEGEVAALEAQNQPLRNQQTELKKKVESLASDKKARIGTLTNVEKARTTKDEESTQCDTEIHGFSQRIAALAGEQKKQREKRDQARRKVEQLTAQLDALPTEVDAESMLAQNQEQQREVTRKMNDINGRKTTKLQEKSDLERSHKQHSQDLKKLSDIQMRRLEELRKMAPDTFRAKKWLDENKQTFNNPAGIYGPICLELDFNGEEDGRFCETIFARRHLTAFVLEDLADFRRFQDEFPQGEVNCLSASRRTTADIRAELPSIESVKRHGAIRYLLDNVRGPEAVLATLCEWTPIHQCLVIKEDANIDALKQITLANARNDDVGAFKNFFKKESCIAVHRSKYSDNIGLATRSLKPSKFLGRIAAGDPGQIDNMTVMVGNLEAQIHAVNAEVQRIDREARDAQIEKARVDNERKSLNTGRNERNSLTKAVARAREELNLQEPDENAWRQKKANLERQVLEARERKVATVEQIHALSAKMIELALKEDMFTLDELFVKQQLQRVTNQINESNQAEQEKKAELRNFSNAMEVEKKRAKELKVEAERVCPLTDELNELFANLPDDLETIDGAIIDFKSRIDMLFVHNPRIVEDYEACEKKKKEVETKLANADGISAEHHEKIEAIKGVWLPSIEAMVKKISTSFGEYFKKIQCVGEVELVTHEDFDQYGIDIKVKFRANDQLARLTANRQSGGERSVSTMLYLISLQDMTTCPFRLVDEINQGMDAVNERKVFSQIVECACRPGLPQYFLITPKLLPDLEYTEQMTVLCIFNGPYVSPDLNAWAAQMRAEREQQEQQARHDGGGRRAMAVH